MMTEIMSFDECLEQNIRRQNSDLIDIPSFVRETLEKVMMDLREDRTKGKAPFVGTNILDIYGEINVIPSKTPGSCRPYLITFCYDGDNFKERIKESLNHATVDCPGICNEIYFLSTQWHSNDISYFIGFIKLLRESGVRIHFIHFTPGGIVVMPA